MAKKGKNKRGEKPNKSPTSWLVSWLPGGGIKKAGKALDKRDERINSAVRRDLDRASKNK